MTLKPDYRDSHTSKDYGKNYHKTFKDHAYRSYIWNQEKRILSGIALRYFEGSIDAHLDFACGTGRILTFFEQYTKSSTGLDISDSMLEVARKEVVRAKLISGDITRNELLGIQTYDLITAFRFFLRAQPQLKNEVMAKLVEHLNSNGYIVFNIHNNKSSISNNISKLYTKIKYRKVSPRDEMSYDEVCTLVNRHGLEVVQTYPYGTFPVFRGEQKFPVKITQFTDGLIKNRYLSTYNIFVCQKKQKTNAP